MASSKKGSAGRPKPNTRPTSARPVTAATRTSAGAPEKGAVSTPLSAKAPAPASGAKTATATPGGPSVRRSASATASQRQRQRQAQLEIQRRRQYITAGVIAVVVIALAIGVFSLLPKSGTSTTKNAAASQSCPAVPAGTPALADAAPTVSGTPVTTSDGLQYIDIHPGCGATVAAGATVTVNYTGWIQGGAMFDSSVKAGGKPFQANLSGGVIQGWQEGLVGMKVGGVRRLIIPPALGYGAQGSPPVIPANATLVFDVSAISIP